MKTLLCTVMLATLSAAAASASVVTITFDQPNQTGGPGSTLQFFGTITNNSSSTVYLNGDDLLLSGLSFTTSDQFFITVPISLAPFGTSGLIELFDVTVSNPLLDGFANFPGAYTLVGGATADAQDVLGSANFSVTTTPEPGSFGLVLAAALAVVAPAARKMRANSGPVAAFSTRAERE